MSTPLEGAERLAEILREILALSETNQPNHSESAAANDAVKSFHTQCVDGSDDISTRENRDCQCQQ
jgi:hypothetical protein